MVEVIKTASYEPPFLPQYTELIRFTPALTATLPGQINPFSYNLLLGKASASIGKVRAVAISPLVGENEYFPLSTVSWGYEGTSVIGIARNETSQTLYHLRVVVVEPGKCRWREATLDSVILQPGQETDFHLNYSSTYCLDESLIIVGQGTTQP